VSNTSRSTKSSGNDPTESSSSSRDRACTVEPALTRPDRRGVGGAGIGELSHLLYGIPGAIRGLEEPCHEFQNLSAIGRGGMYKYNNQDHSTYSGILAAATISSCPVLPTICGTSISTPSTRRARNIQDPENRTSNLVKVPQQPERIRTQVMTGR
jgi:hypothetical protein